MSTFEVKVQTIYIKEHPNADALELGNIGNPDGWQVVCRKGLYKTGDLVAYIGENAVVPEWVLKYYGFWNEEKGKGLLAGSKGDRVKMVKLRGECSLGICIPLLDMTNRPSGNLPQDIPSDDFIYGLLDTQNGFQIVKEGQNVADVLGVTKYEPPIPTQLAGEIFNAGTSIGVNYNIEDYKNFPTALQDGEEVWMSVKIHGTNCQMVWLPPELGDKVDVKIEEWIKVYKDEVFLGYVTYSSKGQGAKGLFFKDNETNKASAYYRAIEKHIVQFAGFCFACKHEQPITIVGEVFGPNIQSGYDYGMKQISFRAFDIYFGFRGQGHYGDLDHLEYWCEQTGIQMVPVVYKGPFEFEIMNILANSPEISFDCKHIREGVITKPVHERYNQVIGLGRVVVKHRSDLYMLRATGEEVQ